VLHCEDVALPTAEACPHGVVDAGVVVVDIGVVPGCVVPVEIPTPLASNNAVEFDVPVIAFPMPGKPVGEHAVVEASPEGLKGPGLTPGVASSVAPRGIPVAPTGAPEGLMPRGEVVPIPKFGLGVPIPLTCA
jgi:hypothetical protein